jgi:hypothetical protein
MRHVKACSVENLTSFQLLGTRMKITLATVLLLSAVTAQAAETAVSVDTTTGVVNSTQPSADDVTSALPQSSATTGGVLKKFEENTQITDEKLKADAGSLTQFSLRANLAYYGPSPANLSELNQPNPDGVVSATSTAISGTLGGRFRLDSSTSISLYAGVSDDYAFHPQQTLDANSPSLSFDKTFRIGGLQILSSPGVTLITQQVYKHRGEVAGATYYLSGVYRLGKSGVSLGAENSIGYYFFGRDYSSTDGKVRQLNMSISPFVKYNFTDRLNVNTYVGLTEYHLRNSGDITNLNDRLVTEKLGVGIAVTRDIYINPYIQFFPSDITVGETTLNIATSFSVL